MESLEGKKNEREKKSTEKLPELVFLKNFIYLDSLFFLISSLFLTNNKP